MSWLRYDFWTWQGSLDGYLNLRDPCMFYQFASWDEILASMCIFYHYGRSDPVVVRSNLARSKVSEPKPKNENATIFDWKLFSALPDVSIILTKMVGKVAIQRLTEWLAPT